MKKFNSYTRETGAGGHLSDIQLLIISVVSAFKHVSADVVGSSSGTGIQESGEI